ncbi:septation ring formation regulator EzrA [Oceanobacillus indicireducens]|uniref:Septation ring formation regulator EzrA n=1 Tax=Oceanobacillus indicireducens TaxID=1004261 RepID=A0A918CY57_9BACI|nr:septation ring formation regulator EzrA [Oceanobacillus indicireducens]GGN48761.1 septation ring formation regulator EzrA [Oceanobacillus indicireducens]
MELFIGIILAIIVLIVIGLILRKRVYDQVDRLEAWKLDIMARNVAGELSKIKNLTLSGETQEKFEAWKERWDYIVGKELADIEEHLLDAEDAADKFRISKAKKVLKETEEILQSIEGSIDNILSELEELLESEKSSRMEVEEVEPAIRELRRQISQNRYQYAKADRYFDAELDKLEAALENFHEESAAGNYMEAKRIVDELKVELKELDEKIHAFPEVYKKAKHELSSQLDQLLSGMKEMKQDGFYIEHLDFEKEIRTYQQRIIDVMTTLEEGNLEEGTKVLDEMEERISEMYELLEEEALAKNYLDQNVPSYKEAIMTLHTSFTETKAEVEELKKAYYVEDEELEKFLAVDKKTQALNNELTEVLAGLEANDVAHSELRGRVEAALGQIDDLKEKHDTFKEAIQTLRKDELLAKDKLAEMYGQIKELHRRLRKSNIPGVPTFIWTSLEETQQRNKKVLEALEQHPLDTGAVHRSLLEAESAIEQAKEKIDMMLDQAYLTERVIQYANRYRSKNPMLAAELVEAERLFRAYEYELALEKAAKAIEQVEPGALKRIEETQLVVND